ncbi:telomere-capping, CST complex subunit-domain-containing protein [Ochromonadaceae sp. CCMP2298]|nr:telomere-capping, CST complex subunit-domain-containing protein [Ochromonadaceae sp. CCMP2298]
MQSGEILLLSEVAQLPINERRYVRVTGRVVALDGGRVVCEVRDGGAGLRVDLSLVGFAEARVDALIQLIGELRPVEDKNFGTVGAGCRAHYLIASVVRNVDGLDVDLFAQALIARRKFLQVR